MTVGYYWSAAKWKINFSYTTVVYGMMCNVQKVFTAILVVLNPLDQRWLLSDHPAWKQMQNRSNRMVQIFLLSMYFYQSQAPSKPWKRMSAFKNEKLTLIHSACILFSNIVVPKFNQPGRWTRNVSPLKIPMQLWLISVFVFGNRLWSRGWSLGSGWPCRWWRWLTTQFKVIHCHCWVLHA